MSGLESRRGRLLRIARRPLALVVIAGALVLAAAAGLAAQLTGPGQSGCQASFVPAYFYSSGTWARAADSKPAPRVMILDISGLGAGSAPSAHFRAVVRQARSKGVRIIGYSSTAYGARPVAAVEADVRHYLAWYGVRGVFLDEVRGVTAQLPYYRQLAGYIRSLTPGAPIWINPGTYPDRSYLSVASVVMAFEGPYASYARISVPQWARQYPADRFAHTIYAASPAQLAQAVSLARARRGGYVYVTDGSGANPYGALPSYWTREVALVAASCPAGSSS
ncbi:MAG: spherulation-specific family 4 protein [Streptosporangiaceae bacterium]